MHNIPDFLRITPEMQEYFANGGMIKRADGSYSRRGLWDNIRANKGSGRKPTREMLKQEAKIRAQEQYGGVVDEYANGGYIVRRSHARKGKTHVVIGPDGTKKYFGDSKLGQHPSDPARKKAFYARHKHNLAHNPYFRAFARATWADGGEVPEFEPGGPYIQKTTIQPGDVHLNLPNTQHESYSPSPFGLNGFIDRDKKQGITFGKFNPYYQTGNFSVGPYAKVFVDQEGAFPSFGVSGSYDVNNNVNINAEANPHFISAGLNYRFGHGGSYGPFYNRTDAAKMQRMFTPSANSMTPYFDLGGFNDEDQVTTANSGTGINTTVTAKKPGSDNKWSKDLLPISNDQNNKLIDQTGKNSDPNPGNRSLLTREFGLRNQDKIAAREAEKQNLPTLPAANKFDAFKNSDVLGRQIGDVSDILSSGLSATSILSRTFKNSEQNAVLNFNQAQDNPTNYLNKVSNFAGIQYAKDGGTIGNYKEGDELELTPTQMYLLEKKGYKFQIINK